MTRFEHNNILDEYYELLTQFVQPLYSRTELNKETLYAHILDLFQHLVNSSQLSYYCTKCRRAHFRGEIFQRHQQYSQPSVNFPAIPLLSAENTLHMQIVGVYYTNNGPYLENLASGTKLSLLAEPNNLYDSTAVSVWHQDHKLGYLPRYENQATFMALQQGYSVKCILGQFHPTYNYRPHSRHQWYSGWDSNDSVFRPERADITINIFNEELFVQIFNGLMEIYMLTHEKELDIIPALRKLGPRIFPLLEKFAIKHFTIPKIKELLSELYQTYEIQIHVKQEEKMSILL